MTLSEFERKRCEHLVAAFVERRRPPPHVRAKLDLGFRVADQSIVIFEIRPQLNQPDAKLEHPVAKATFVRGSSVWQVFWRRQDLKWHRYDPAPEVDSIEAWLKVVAEDEHGCFWG